MKLHIPAMFAVMALFCLASTTLVAGPVNFVISDDSLKVQMVRDWERAKAYTKAYLEAMPEDGVSFKPTPDVRSFAEQFLHLSNATIFFISSGTGKTKIYDGKNLEKLDEYKTKAALIKVVMECYDYAIDAVKGLDAAKLSEPVAMGPNKFSRYTWVCKGFEHQTHHRGQTTIYLRLKGATPPGEMLF